ncbi:MAG: autotransporter outer membrane beta-barrel domain-containing protein, partial [Puniceicoccales bacterium]|nr:autotransporter outer membrane beta-barrel domain-containing protein [Puniceicoccales bacterium]
LGTLTGARTSAGAWDGDEITFATAGASIEVHETGVVASGLNINADTTFTGGAINVTAGIGITWQIGETTSLRLDYEAAFGDRYESPVRLNLGFRKRF